MAEMDIPIGGEFTLPGAGTLATKPDIPQPKSPEEAAALTPGTKFRDPQGKERIVPYKVKDQDEAEALPEGAQFTDPQGVLRTKPTYEGLDFTTQTLYNMAVNDSERKKALERGYGQKVKQNKRTGEYFVDDDGTLRKSKGFTQAPGAFLAGQAAPVAGSIAGEIAGAAGGTAIAPGVGTFGGAVAGGAAGGAAGQAFNDAIMGLAGIYDRTGGEEAANLGLSAAFGGGGTAVGRGLLAAAPAIKGVVQNALPKAAAGILGADKGGIEAATRLRDQGVMVPPSIWAKEAPHFINIAEVFDPAFRTQKPLLQSATQHYEKTAGKLLEDMGVKSSKPLSDPEAAVSTEKAGEAVLGRTREELRQADEELRKALDQRRTLAASGKDAKATEYQSHMAQLQKAETEARQAAQKVIDEGFNSIQQSADAAMAAAKAGHNSGDLWWSVGEQLKKMRSGIAARASKMYGEADELSGGLKPDISDLPIKAQDFLNQLPEGFEGKYPTIVKQLRDMAGVQKLDKEGNPTGEWAKEPVHPTWAQLHNLRSVLRANYNSLDLTPDVKQGTFKFFANSVDRILSDTEAQPELAAAAKRLREADTFYRENMGPLQDKRIQAVMDGLESGLPADPKVLFDTIVKEGRSDLTKKISNLVGPNLWAGVKSADVKEMLDQSKSLTPGQIDGRRFAQQVLERHRSGMLEAVHGREVSEQLLRQAQNIAMLDGKLDIGIRPGDKIADVIGKARAASDAVKEAAKQDPLGTLNKEMKTIEREHNQTLAKARQQRSTDPLSFLYNPTTGASDAVNRILDKEDLIIAAASKFGQNSPEFKMLRQVWAQRLLTGTLEPGERLSKVSEEVQRIMFPGVGLDQMRQLAKDMNYLMSSRASKDTAKSMAAVAKVEHPWGSIPLGKAAGKLIPGADFAGRVMLGKYYKFITELVNNPAFLRFVEKGLKGNDQARANIKELVQSRMKIGGAAGAGVGESQYSTPNQNVMLQ